MSAQGRDPARGAIVAPRVRDLGELQRQLAPWLARRLPQRRDLKLADFRYPSGAGMSHETILFEAGWTEAGGPRSQGLVIRIKPVANPVFPDDLFDSQYRVMRLIHEKGWLPVAEPLWLEPDDTVVGAPFFVMKQVKGRVPVSRPPYAREGWIAEASPEQRAKLWRSAVGTLARIHCLPTDELGFLEGPPGARRGLEQEWDKYARFVEWISRDRRWPVLDAALEALRRRWPDNRPAGLVWGGAEMVNMMFDEDFEVAAVMDWEQPSLGGPLNDLAWWLVMADMKHGPGSGHPPLEGLGTREETLALWSQLTGLCADDIGWYEDFMALKIQCLAVSTARVWGVPPPDPAPLAERLGLTLSG